MAHGLPFLPAQRARNAAVQFNSPYWVVLSAVLCPSDPGISVSAKSVEWDGGSKGPERTATPGRAAAAGATGARPAASASARLKAATSSASIGSNRAGPLAGAKGAGPVLDAGSSGAGAVVPEGVRPSAVGVVGKRAAGSAGNSSDDAGAATGAGAAGTGAGTGLRTTPCGAAADGTVVGVMPFCGRPTATWSLMRQ